MSKSEQLEVRICLLCCFFVTECNAGYYGSGNDTCTLCPGNTIKSVQGDASGCNAETPCDCVSNEVNAEHTACGEYPIVFFFLTNFTNVSVAVFTTNIKLSEDLSWMLVLT